MTEQILTVSQNETDTYKIVASLREVTQRVSTAGITAARNYIHVDLNGVATAVGNGAYPFLMPFSKSSPNGVDVDGVFSNATSRYTPTVAGKYLVQMDTLWLTVLPFGTLIGAGLFKNGVEYAFPLNCASGAGNTSQNMVAVIEMNGATDYLTWSVYQNSGNSASLNVPAARTYASAIRIG